MSANFDWMAEQAEPLADYLCDEYGQEDPARNMEGALKDADLIGEQFAEYIKDYIRGFYEDLL